MRKKEELLQKINAARMDLETAYLKKNRFEEYYEKSLRLDKLLEEYIDLDKNE